MEWTLAQVNMAGRAFVGFAWPVLVESAALVGVVLLVEVALRKKVRAALRYRLAALVLIYLLLTPLFSLGPPSPRWPTSNAAYADPTTTSSAAAHTHAPLSQPPTGQSQTTSAGVGERPRSLSWQGGVFLLWLVGLVVIGGVLVRRALRACRSVKDSPAANLLMTDILTYCRRRMGVLRRAIPRSRRHTGICGPQEGADGDQAGVAPPCVTRLNGHLAIRAAAHL